MTETPATYVRATIDVSGQRVARVYAEALLDEAQAHNLAEQVLEELELLQRDVAGADPLLANFFLGGVVGRQTRADALRRAFEGKVSGIFLNFLLVLNDHQRLDLLRSIIEQYGTMYEARSGKIRVRVRSAVPLDDDHRNRLTEELRQATRLEPILDARVDPELLGGVVVQVADFLFDGSVRAQIETIRNQLIESTSHAIQAGRDRFSTEAANQ
jgi:F-type H+-transporting ATPase subunit delta